MPSQADNPTFVEWFGRMQRQSASPADFVRQLLSIVALEAPSDLSSINVPTLVVHVVGDRVVPFEGSRVLAEAIPDARFVEWPGEDHYHWLMQSWRQLSDVVLAFVIGDAPRSQTTKRLATVPFSDLVDSTAISSSMGDEAWRSTLESHNRIAFRVIGGYGGQIVKSTGDGLLATFDDPSAAVSAGCSLSKEVTAIGLTMRGGIHTGQIEVHEDQDISGLAVNLAARIEHAAQPGAVFTSSTVRDLLLGSEHRFADRGNSN